MALRTRLTARREIGTSLSEINVTPFVDVMLVLLIIFMVTAPMMKSGVSVNLPQAETESAPAEEGLTLTISRDRYIHLEKSIVNINLLEGKLREYFYTKDKKIVFIEADKDLPYGYVMSVLDVTKKAGVEVVGLVTQPIDETEKKK